MKKRERNGKKTKGVNELLSLIQRRFFFSCVVHTREGITEQAHDSYGNALNAMLVKRHNPEAVFLSTLRGESMRIRLDM